MTEDRPEVSPPPMDAPEPALWNDSFPNLIEHRMQMRCLVERAEHAGDVHGDD